MMPALSASPAPTHVARVLTFLLTHPGTMRVKRRLRDLVWEFKGRSIRNPPVPRGPRSILFVCLGNICRSPFAAARARDLLTAAGIAGVTCGSAGIRAGQAARPPLEACEAAAPFGVRLESHEPLQLTRELVEAFDVIVVMEHWHITSLRADYPEAADRIMLMSLFGASDGSPATRYNIADPFGQPSATFDACYARIDDALRGLLVAAGWAAVA